MTERLRGRAYDTAPQPKPTTDNAEADLTMTIPQRGVSTQDGAGTPRG